MLPMVTVQSTFFSQTSSLLPSTANGGALPDINLLGDECSANKIYNLSITSPFSK